MSSTKTTHEDIYVLMILLLKEILKIRDRNKDYFSKEKERQEGKMNIYVGIAASKPSLSTWYKCIKCDTLVQVEPCSVNLNGGVHPRSEYCMSAFFKTNSVSTLVWLP